MTNILGGQGIRLFYGQVQRQSRCSAYGKPFMHAIIWTNFSEVFSYVSHCTEFFIHFGADIMEPL
jgi:hypothetical protein